MLVVNWMSTTDFLSRIIILYQDDVPRRKGLISLMKNFQNTLKETLFLSARTPEGYYLGHTNMAIQGFGSRDEHRIAEFSTEFMEFRVYGVLQLPQIHVVNNNIVSALSHMDTVFHYSMQAVYI